MKKGDISLKKPYKGKVLNDDGTDVVALLTPDGKVVVTSADKDKDKDKKKKAMASVSFSEQTSDGKHVAIQSVTMSKGGFVAIHDCSFFDGNGLGSVIGVSKKLKPGTHKNVKVTLFSGVPGAKFKMSSLQKTQKLIAMPHLDTNDNGTYDFITSKGKKDGPYTKDGKPVVDVGCIRL